MSATMSGAPRLDAAGPARGSGPASGGGQGSADEARRGRRRAAERRARGPRLSFWYGAKQALFDIQFEMPPRSITALIGPSGCGKSTFLRSINRMHDLLPGTRHTGTSARRRDIYDPTLDADRAPAPSRDGVPALELLPQVDLRQRRLRAADQHLAPAASSIGSWSPRSVARALWDEVKDRLRQAALGLSGGQQQRLCIARTLANEPEVLLLDEPASALDPIATQKIEELLYELKRELTIVIVTHNLQQAARASDHTAFFYMGRLIEVGPTDRIFTAPREERTNSYITGRFG